ncbi:hypothetical protein VKT23_003556 [Stygiomarasmius scandens]|uniref:PH domain-containing protein n=1 Tax=Marasmiellus scandens TaxID=2682957 RepID=A0ABR1JZ32_9AGAR
MSEYYDPFDAHSSLAAFSVPQNEINLLDDDPFAASPSKSKHVPRTPSLRTTPAHAKPAFKPRPSLPSIKTLSTMDVHLVLPKKPRKGHVGAQLPFEPWDLPTSPLSSSETTPNDFFIPAPSPTGNCFLADMDGRSQYISDDSSDDGDYHTPLQVLEESEEEHAEDASETRYSSSSSDCDDTPAWQLHRSVSQHSGSTNNSLGPISPAANEFDFARSHYAGEDYLSYNHNPSFLTDRDRDATIRAVSYPQKIDPESDIDLFSSSSSSSSSCSVEDPVAATGFRSLPSASSAPNVASLRIDDEELAQFDPYIIGAISNHNHSLSDTVIREDRLPALSLSTNPSQSQILTASQTPIDISSSLSSPSFSLSTTASASSSTQDSSQLAITTSNHITPSSSSIPLASQTPTSSLAVDMPLSTTISTTIFEHDGSSVGTIRTIRARKESSSYIASRTSQLDDWEQQAIDSGHNTTNYGERRRSIVPTKGHKTRESLSVDGSGKLSASPSPNSSPGKTFHYPKDGDGSGSFVIGTSPISLEMVDSGYGSSSASASGRERAKSSASSGSAHVTRNMAGYPYGSGSASGTGSGRGRGREDEDDGDDDYRRNITRRFAAPSSDEISTSETEEESEDDYGVPSAQLQVHAQHQPYPHTLPAHSQKSSSRRPSSSTSPSSGDEDDNVPLARSIPTALQAQKSIRAKDREAREKKRRERAKEKEREKLVKSEVLARQADLLNHNMLPPGAAPATVPPVMSSAQEAAVGAMQAQTRSQGSMRRPRQNTMPYQASSPFAGMEFGVASGVGAVSLDRRQVSANAWLDGQAQAVPFPDANANSNSNAGAKTLRPMRSFHKSEPRRDDFSHVPLPFDASEKLARNANPSPTPTPTPVPVPTGMRQRSKSVSARDDPRQRSRGLSTTPNDAPPLPNMPKRSLDERSPPKKSLDGSRPPVPPPSELVARQKEKQGAALVQQRIFIGDRQRFVVVEINQGTSAGDVIRMVEEQGALKEWRGSGGWMLFEIAQDFGMERPVRGFELLSDIESSWNKDKLVNVFLLKLTPYAALLSRSNMPTFSPTFSGYIEWESKRGKWVKRYMVLREHSLYLSKRDNGKDEVLLCSLSNYDVYRVTRLIKAPKEYTFALKSTDNLSFFEDTADYLHMFSCRMDKGEAWMEKILLARSYVLYQERNVLSKPSNTAQGPAAGGATGLSRNPTRKAAQKPLLNVNGSSIFEPGSLLRQ